ncbi:DDE-type integrase/transposase/recombinase [Tepidibacillus sp. HK-1]|uniref:DDE-type integrase/transposase/recombinase n=1 Tax=Tepidibacillus sp. HK-1 TaxID=1883407 RepID=UPI0037D9BAE5
MDLHSKKIVGHSFSRSMTTDLVIHALENVITAQNTRKNLTLHTDLGSQYTSHEFREYVNTHLILPLWLKRALVMQ